MCNYDHCKLKCVRSFNAIYFKCTSAKSELVCVELLKAYCLLVIMYSLEATWPSKTVTNMLDNLNDFRCKKDFSAKRL